MSLDGTSFSTENWCTGFARETFISAPAKYSSQSLPIYFYVFYLLNRNGEPLVNLPFFRRRELLESLLAAPKDPLRLSPLLQTPSGQVLEAVRKLGLEGVVGKRIDYCERRQHHGSQSVRAQTNQNPRGIDLLFFPSLLEFEPSTFWRSFKEPVKVDPKNGLNPFLFHPIQYISTLTGRFELPRGGWSGDAILAHIANVRDLIQSRKLSGICFVFILGHPQHRRCHKSCKP